MPTLPTLKPTFFGNNLKLQKYTRILSTVLCSDIIGKFSLPYNTVQY